MAFKVNQPVRRRAWGSDEIPEERRTLRYSVLAIGRDDLSGFIKIDRGGLVVWESSKQFEPIPQL